MKCADPVLCYIGTKGKIYRHFSLATPLMKLNHQQVFDCGKCIICRKKKSRELAMRCVLHASLYTNNCFLTLTYDEKKETYHNKFQYKDIQDFKKRLRRHCEPKKVQIFNVHEYGKNGKKHWHLVVFNHDFEDKTLFTTKNGNSIYTSKKLEQLWPFGFNTICDVTEASAMYQAQYTQKDFKNGNVLNDRKSHSKHSGLAREYFLTHYRQILSLGYVPFNGKKVPVPRYFEKLAHKHYAHFYAPEFFCDTISRKRLYRPFSAGQANEDMAKLFLNYRKTKESKIAEMSEEWESELKNYIFNKDKPNFRLAAENFEYDLKNKLQQEKF